MKKFIVLMLIFALCAALSACTEEELPLNENSDSVSEVSAPEEPKVNEIYEHLKAQSGGDLYLEYLENGYFGGFFYENWDDPEEFSPDNFTFYYELTEISRMVLEDIEAGNKVPKVMEIPEDEVQSYIMSFFNVSADYLRNASNYNPESKTYSFSTEGGFGGGPGYGVYEIKDLGNDLYLFYCDTGEEGSVKANITLEIKKLGSYRYIACEYHNSIYEENPTAEFTLGFEGEPKTLKQGDSIGEWVLDELKIQRDSETGNVNRATGIFKGTVVLEGKISRSVLAENRYDFAVNKKDAEKIPNYVHPDSGKDRSMFMLEIPRMIENYPNLDYGEELKVRITVSEYSSVFAYSAVPDGLTVTKIEIIE